MRESQEDQGRSVQEAPHRTTPSRHLPSAMFPSLPATLKLVSMVSLWVSLTLVITVGNSATNQDFPKRP